ncbi:hypothetical protein E4T56_gene18077, partial [Termitomyces sp. T112]
MASTIWPNIFMSHSNVFDDTPASYAFPSHLSRALFKRIYIHVDHEGDLKVVGLLSM